MSTKSFFVPRPMTALTFIAAISFGEANRTNNTSSKLLLTKSYNNKPKITKHINRTMSSANTRTNKRIKPKQKIKIEEEKNY